MNNDNNNDFTFICFREISHTVFPSRVEASQLRYVDDDGDIGLFSPTIKRSRQEVSLLNDDTSRLMESVLRKNIHSSMDVNARFVVLICVYSHK